jgi:hypothetical protein
MRTVLAASFAIALGTSATALAQSEPAPTSSVGTTVSPSAGGETGPTVWGILPWNGVGIGARFMMPLKMIPPLIKGNPNNIRDSFALEFGADYLHWSYDYPGLHDYSWSEFLPVVGAMWNVWFNEHIVAYPKLELGYAFGWFSNWDYGGNQPTYGGFFWDVALGAMYKLNNGLSLRVEAGYAGLKLGVGWLF